MLIQMFAVMAICAGASTGDKTAIYGWNHEIVSPRDAASAQKLERALQRFERDLAAKGGGQAAGSSKPKEIVVVGSKIKRSAPRASAGGFKSVSGLDSEIDVVEFRAGQDPTSLPSLQAAISKFESAAGPGSPCVATCRAAQRRCQVRCRRALKAKGLTGRCVCDHIRARCLVRAAKQGKCTRPDAQRRRRGIRR